MNIWFFLIVSTFLQCQYWPQIKTRPLELSQMAIFSRKVLNKHLLVVFSFLYIFFGKLYILKIIKQGFQRFLKSKSFSLSNHGWQAFTIFFFKFVLWILQFGGGWHLNKFLKNHKTKKSLSFSCHHYQRFSKSPREIRNCKKINLL